MMIVFLAIGVIFWFCMSLIGSINHIGWVRTFLGISWGVISGVAVTYFLLLMSGCLRCTDGLSGIGELFGGLISMPIFVMVYWTALYHFKNQATEKTKRKQKEKPS